MARPDIAERLDRFITREGLEPQERLPAERQLARQLGVSRGTLRQGLLLLEREGKVWRHVGRGTFVGGRPPDPEENLARLVRMTSPQEVMEVRLIFEPTIAAFAALRANAEDLAEMTRSLREGARAQDIAEFERWDGAFHRALARATHNRFLLSIFDAVNAVRDDRLWGRLKEATMTPAARGTYVRQHEAILAAVGERDAGKAERLMGAHLAAVRQNLLERHPALSHPRPG